MPDRYEIEIEYIGIDSAVEVEGRPTQLISAVVVNVGRSTRPVVFRKTYWTTPHTWKGDWKIHEKAYQLGQSYAKQCCQEYIDFVLLAEKQA